ncbi:kinase-like protein [Schizophyllum amplum]|uniref:non-specific serine/threonine protein kinase n=1 Tax=Schizophyllum amplum TaxID=97359 RepID=A0A550C2I3_9AGAR|nr:kinase-like protein [Auriculariopsis ampla]
MSLNSGDFHYYSIPEGLVEEVTRYEPGGFHPVVIGDIIEGYAGHYRIMHKLGFGTYATVWLAQRIDQSRGFVALKITTSGDQGHREADMLDAAAAAARADSEPSNILTSLDKFQVHGPNGTHAVLVTEVVAPLTSLGFRHQPPRWRKLVAYGLVKALIQLHEAEVVHGDLHLGNVGLAMPQLAEQNPDDVMQDIYHCEITLVLPRNPINQTPSLPPYVLEPCKLGMYYHQIAGSADPQPKLYDFGNARRFGESPSGYNACAIEACPPEVAYARAVDGIFSPPVEPPADIWALGTAIFELLAAFTPFRGLGSVGLPEYMARMAGHVPAQWSAWWETESLSPVCADEWWGENRPYIRRGCANDDDTEAAIRLLKKILLLDPCARPSPEEIIRDPWFQDVV